jgi:tetratricopeptide (TPR) repeat protein
MLQNLAMVYHQMGKYKDAIDTYERLLSIDSSQAAALNNLAWLLITSPDRALRDQRRALVLAEKAVVIERIPTFLDTLAEAQYANGSVEKAIEIIKEAISLEKKDNAYYKSQLRKYMRRLEAR